MRAHSERGLTMADFIGPTEAALTGAIDLRRDLRASPHIKEGTFWEMNGQILCHHESEFWTADPKKTPYRDCFKNGTPGGYAGTMGYASAASIADFIIPNMVAEAGSGAKTPKEAAERAQKRAERYYKV